jgi:hypothetical protein
MGAIITGAESLTKELSLRKAMPEYKTLAGQTALKMM